MELGKSTTSRTRGGIPPGDTAEFYRKRNAEQSEFVVFPSFVSPVAGTSGEQSSKKIEMVKSVSGAPDESRTATPKQFHCGMMMQAIAGAERPLLAHRFRF